MIARQIAAACDVLPADPDRRQRIHDWWLALVGRRGAGSSVAGDGLGWRGVEGDPGLWLERTAAGAALSGPGAFRPSTLDALIDQDVSRKQLKDGQTNAGRLGANLF